MSPEIPKTENLEKEVFRINNETSFRSIALEVYQFQYQNNPLYQRFSDALRKNPSNVDSLEQIPFLPVSVFKTGKVLSSELDPELVFESSGTTAIKGSLHFVTKASLYKESFTKTFTAFFGPPDEYCILAVLPSYLERGNSSLVYMADQLMTISGHSNNGFYLHEQEKLKETLEELEKKGQKTILLGVSYALLDLAEQFPMALEHTAVVETGGMKGRRKELSKQELYAALKKGFGVSRIYSEYGMTELLSQAYAVDGVYTTPPWMKVLLREESDPLQIIRKTGQSGVINIIDLANIYSCSFIATDDAGKKVDEDRFEIIGRVDNSDIRGCSLMVV
jgi:phenylacetate-coenzyme A ligase PaaK-like adenylate-forming protein